MKYFSLLLLLILTGAGCLPTAPTSKGSDGGVLKTTDAGKTWASMSAVPTPKGVGTLATANIVSLKMDPTDSKVMYVGTREDGMLMSDDGGTSWRQVREKNLATGLVASFEIDPKNTCTLYVVKGPRLYKTTDCLRTFQSDAFIESRSGVNVTQVAIDPQQPQTVWIGLSNGDVMKSLDGAKTWANVLHSRGAVSSLLVHTKEGRNVLAASATKGIQRTSDSGSTWQEVTPKLSGGLIVHDLIQSKNSEVVVAATQYGLVRSGNFGESWDPIKLVSAPGQVEIQAAAMDVSNPQVLYYATSGALYKTIDGGLTWQTVKIPSNRLPYAMVVDPTLNTVIYLGLATSVK